MWRSLYQTDGHGTVVLKCFQFRPSLVAVCFVGLFTGRSVAYNNVAQDRVLYKCDSIQICFLKSVTSAQFKLRISHVPNFKLFKIQVLNP